MISYLFKMFSTNYLSTNHIYSKYMYKKDLALNNQQGFIYHDVFSFVHAINLVQDLNHQWSSIFFAYLVKSENIWRAV